jgi:hypothetical protein
LITLTAIRLASTARSDASEAWTDSRIAPASWSRRCPTHSAFSGSGGGSIQDTLVRLDIESGQVNVVLDGAPFSLGGIACDVVCGACFVTDSDRQGGVVHRFAVDATGRLSDDRAIKAESSIGLAPRTLGKF